MSKAVIPIPAVAIHDPVTRLSRPTAWGVNQGGIVYTYQQVKATTWSGAGGSLVNFVAPPPSPEIIFDRRVQIQAQFYLTFTCTPLAGVPVLQLGTNDGPRAFPLMQSINTISATINNNTITALMDPIIALMRYNLPFMLQQREYTGTPCMLDQYQEYDFWNGQPVLGLPLPPNNFQQGGGALRNPLTSYGEALECPSRGGFLMQIVQNPLGDGINPMTAALIMTVTEPIFMLPFAQWGDEPGFYGVQTLNISFTLNASWWLRTWSSNLNKPGTAGGTVDAPNAGGTSFSPNGITGNIPNAPTLLFRYITPSPISVLPALMEYPYVQTVTYTTQITPGAKVPSVFANPADTTATSAGIQFSTIPDQIMIYLFRQPADRNHLTSDTFMAIKNISINFMNQTGLLSSATQKDLYDISARRGYQGTFDQWRYLTGSVLCLCPGLDLGLEPSLAPGMNGLYNFQCTIVFNNPSSAPVNVVMYIVTLTSGLVTIKDNGTVTQTGLITRSDVLAAQQSPSIGWTEAVKLVGGDFFSAMKKPFGDLASAAFNQWGIPLGNQPVYGAGRYGAGFDASGQVPQGYQQPAGQVGSGMSLSSELDAPNSQYSQYYNQEPYSPESPRESEHERRGHRRHYDDPAGPPPISLSRQRHQAPRPQETRDRDGPRFR